MATRRGPALYPVASRSRGRATHVGYGFSPARRDAQRHHSPVNGMDGRTVRSSVVPQWPLKSTTHVGHGFSLTQRDGRLDANHNWTGRVSLLGSLPPVLMQQVNKLWDERRTGAEICKLSWMRWTKATKPKNLRVAGALPPNPRRPSTQFSGFAVKPPVFARCYCSTQKSQAQICRTRRRAKP